MAKDPVCGMVVDERQAAANVEHRGSLYYFCSARCHQIFSADPRKYLVPGSAQETGAKSVP